MSRIELAWLLLHRNEPVRYQDVTMPASSYSALSILRRKAVLAEVGFSDATMKRRIKAKTFPKPVKLGAQIVGWHRRDIEAWLANPAGWAPEAK